MLDKIERLTLGHYETNAESFWQGTRDHDVSQNIDTFLNALAKHGQRDEAQDILDFGCGPGRDLQTFKNRGHRPVGLDGSEAFCEMARQHSGREVLHQQFLSLDLGENRFNGIFANASMFHVPGQELPRVLKACHRALRVGGILFMSNPRGNAEGWQGERYGHYMEFDDSKACLEQAGFTVLDHYYRPAGKPRQQQPWLAIVSQR
ncbi:MAG: class I SAM-dependent methyltransferase [Gammaproteobacteria bacterium]|nr:class I SAM-dependent methyltransferase [Gammaproteobacteria bacterium]MBQ0838344.1 class I SAM-dependent methyltransferase [Gammaproteobacteria bacterium]